MSKEAFPSPEFKFVVYRERKELASKIEADLRDNLIEGKLEFTPREYHSTELIDCPIKSGWERYQKLIPTKFDEVNPLLIGSSMHRAISTLIPNSIAERKFGIEGFDPILLERLQKRPDPISIIFTVDIYRGNDPEKGKTAVIYEIKVKESLDNMFDNELMKNIQINDWKTTNVTPGSPYLNQLIPYEVVSEAERGSLLYIPKMMFTNSVVYEVVFLDPVARLAVQKKLVERAETLARVEATFENEEPLDFTIIEPSGMCDPYCDFGRPKVSYSIPEKKIEQQCPVYLLPTDTKIKKAAPEVKNLYSILLKMVQAKMGKENFDVRRHFQYLSEKRPELITLAVEEIIGETHLRPEVLDEYLKSLEGWYYIKWRDLNGKQVVEVVPNREAVRRGWGLYLYHPYYPTIYEAAKVAQQLEEKMAAQVSEVVFQAYDGKGLFGCPKLQYFANTRKTAEGLLAQQNLGQAKLHYIDMAIWAELQYIACETSITTAKFNDYSFRVSRLAKRIDPQSKPIIWIPIWRTEWREISGRRRVPKNPVITPMAKHIYQAGLLATVLKEDVFLGYYPRKKHGDIRLYEVHPDDPESITKMGNDFVRKVGLIEPITNDYKAFLLAEVARLVKEQGLSENDAINNVRLRVRNRELLPIFICRWCIMRYACDEGRALLNWLAVSLEAEKTEEASTEESEILLTF